MPVSNQAYRESCEETDGLGSHAFAGPLLPGAQSVRKMDWPVTHMSLNEIVGLNLAVNRKSASRTPNLREYRKLTCLAFFVSVG